MPESDFVIGSTYIKTLASYPKERSGSVCCDHASAMIMHLYAVLVQRIMLLRLHKAVMRACIWQNVISLFCSCMLIKFPYFISVHLWSEFAFETVYFYPYN